MKQYCVLVLLVLFANLPQAQITLYGITRSGGIYNDGTIFSYNPITNSFDSLLSLHSSIGDYAYCSLNETFDGNLFGMTYDGGAYSNGDIFEYNPSTSVYTDVVDFTADTGAYMGEFANAHLLQASDSNLYGMTPKGGKYGFGNLFKYNPSTGIFTNLFSFTGDTGAYIGEVPNGGLIQVKNNGKLYGLTSSGGIYGYGNIFSYDIFTGIFTDLIDMTGDSGSYVGNYPNGSLIQASDGNLYGMTAGSRIFPGGTGTIFKYDPYTNVYSDLIDFTGDSGAFPGKEPFGSLVQVTDSCLYGMTSRGGILQKGSMFKYNPLTGIFTNLFDFTGSTGGYIGWNPYGSLIQASDGNLYGMTFGAFVTNGNIFSFNPSTLVFTDLIDFTLTSGPYYGAYPFADLLEYKNVLTETSNTKNLLNKIVISPNPSTGIFNIAISQQLSAISQIEVFNVLGEKVYSKYYPPSAVHYSLDLSLQPNGVYFYRVVGEDGSTMGNGKLIIQH